MVVVTPGAGARKDGIGQVNAGFGASVVLILASDGFQEVPGVVPAAGWALGAAVASNGHVKVVLTPDPGERYLEYYHHPQHGNRKRSSR